MKNENPKYRIDICNTYDMMPLESVWTDENFLDIMKRLENNLAVFPSIKRWQEYKDLED